MVRTLWRSRSGQQMDNTATFSYDYAGGGYFTCHYVFDAALQQNGSINVTLNGSIVDDGSKVVQTTKSANFSVPQDGETSFSLEMESTGTAYHNGPANLTGTATNKQ